MLQILRSGIRAFFVSSLRITDDLNRLSWFSNTPYLSVLLAPNFAPKRLVVDPLRAISGCRARQRPQTSSLAVGSRRRAAGLCRSTLVYITGYDAAAVELIPVAQMGTCDPGQHLFNAQVWAKAHFTLPIEFKGLQALCLSPGGISPPGRSQNRAVLSWQTPSFSACLRIGAEPQTFACVGLSGRSAQIKTGSVNLLGSTGRLRLVRLE